MSASDDFVFFDHPATVVEENLETMNDRADAAIQTVNNTLSALSSFTVEAGTGAGNLTIPDIVIPSPVTPSAPTGLSFGTISTPSDPSIDDFSEGIDDTLTLAVTPFASTAGSFNIPDAPDAIDVTGVPTAPTPAAITVPGAPTLALESPPTFTEIAPRTFAGISAPTWGDPGDPGFSAAAPTGIAYTGTTSYTASISTTLSILAGLGIPPAVEDALFSAARSREEQTALAAEQDAWDAFAGRNFSMPPGSLARTLDVARERSRFNLNTLSRDVFTKAAAWAIENLRVAVANGVTLEGHLISLHNAAAQRTFEAAKSQSEIEVKIYEAAVALYNAKQQARQIYATQYKAQWDGEVAKVQAFRAEVEAQSQTVAINESRAKAYAAQVDGLRAAAEMHNSIIRGVEAQASVEKLKVDIYGSQVAGFRETINARKAEFEAYAERMRGEAARGQMLEGESRAFAETVRAAEAESNVKIKAIDLRIQAARASTERYVARTQYLREQVNAQVAGITAAKEAYVADTGRYTAEIQGSNQAAANVIQVAEARLRSHIAYFESQMRMIDADLNRTIEAAKVNVESLKSTAQVGATLAAGAMSAIHVSAAIHGSGSVSSSNSFSRTQKLPDLT